MELRGKPENLPFQIYLRPVRYGMIYATIIWTFWSFAYAQRHQNISCAHGVDQTGDNRYS